VLSDTILARTNPALSQTNAQAQLRGQQMQSSELLPTGNLDATMLFQEEDRKVCAILPLCSRSREQSPAYFLV